MRRLIAAFLMAVPALARAETPPARMPMFARSPYTQPVALYDADGNIVGGLGAPPSAAIAVRRTAGIGTTGILISPADPAARRTVANTGTVACELMPAAAAYGTGFPLPAGTSFTFDAGGRTTADLFVACAAAGGAVAVLSY